MKIIKKNNRLLVYITILALVTGCSNPDDEVVIEDSIPMDDDFEVLDLTLTVETEEDQIGAISSNAMSVFSGEVWSVGGSRPGVTINQSDIWHSENGVAWGAVGDNPFDYREESKLINYDNTLWLIGGRNLEGDPMGEVWSSEDGLVWNLVTNTPAFIAAVNHDLVVFNNRLFLITRSIIEPEHTSVWSSTNGLDWDLETDNAFSGREEFSAIVFNNAIYVLGGFDPTDSALPITNEIWTSTNGSSWSQLTTNTIFTPRYAHTATVYNNKVFVAGGIGRNPSFGILGSLWFSEDMVNWFEHEPFTSEIGITDHSALVFDDKLWLFFGIEGGVFPDGEQTSKIFSINEE